MTCYHLFASTAEVDIVGTHVETAQLERDAASHRAPAGRWYLAQSEMRLNQCASQDVTGISRLHKYYELICGVEGENPQNTLLL